METIISKGLTEINQLIKEIVIELNKETLKKMEQIEKLERAKQMIRKRKK